MRSFSWTCIALAVAASCSLGCSTNSTPQAGLMIIISTNMSASEFDSVQVEVSQERGVGAGFPPPIEDEKKRVPDEVRLPTTVFVRSGQAADQDALIKITAYQQEKPVVLREAQLQIPTDRVAELRLVLAKLCKEQTVQVGAEGEPMPACPIAGQSCQPSTGMCGDSFIPVGSLSAYKPGDELDSGVDESGSSGESAPEARDSGSSSSGSSGSASGPGSSSSGSSSSGSSSSGSSSSGSSSSGSGPGKSSSGSSSSGSGPGSSSSGSGPGISSSGGSSSGSGPGSSSSGGPCTNACTAQLTQCASSGVQTCNRQANGCTQWVATTTCGAHQTCALPDAGTASCQCDSTVCTQEGTVCQGAQTVATCTKDANNCLYVASTKTCTAPESCAGASPVAACAPTCNSTCIQGQATCVAAGLETCTLGTNGCWAYGVAVACGAHQACTGAAGSASCKCKTDPVCTTVGSVCANASTLASCGQDAQGCFYEATSSACTNGACSAGACCTNACTGVGNACLTTSSIQSCTVGANGCTVATPSACGSGLVCERYGSQACVDPNWAEWPVVDNPNYTDNGDGTVIDNGTSLVWEQSAPSTTYSQTMALAYCAALSLGGHTDWRLPSAVELVSIVDPGASRPSIDSTVFLGTPPLGQFWSSTTYAAPSDAYSVSFLDGSVQFAPTSYTVYVRCVR